jgi:hypothetical protein
MRLVEMHRRKRHKEETQIISSSECAPEAQHQPFQDPATYLRVYEHAWYPNHIYLLHDIESAPALFAVVSITVVLYSTSVLSSCWSKLVADARMSAYISPP